MTRPFFHFFIFAGLVNDLTKINKRKNFLLLLARSPPMPSLLTVHVRTTVSPPSLRRQRRLPHPHPPHEYLARHQACGFPAQVRQ